MKTKKISRYTGLLSILVLGVFLRLVDIAKPFSGLGKWNEGHYATTALNYYKYGLALPMNEYGLDITTPPIYTWLVHLSFRMFGVSEWAARVPSFFFGVLSIVLVYLIARELYTEKTGLVAAFITSVSPGIVYFSRNVQLESMFTAFALGAMLCLLYYKGTGKAVWYLASIVALTLAIFTKYPAVLVYPALIWIWFRYGSIGKNRPATMFIYLIFPLIPSLIWFAGAMMLKTNLTTWYFYKPEGASWTLSIAATALYEAVTRFIPEHFGYIFYYPFVLLTPFLLREGKKHSAILFFALPWPLLMLVFPEFYLNNMYYHYTMLYGMAILLGYQVAVIAQKTTRTKSGLLIAALLVLVFSVNQYNTLFHSYYTDFSKANESEPFQSAKYISMINTGHEPVIADYPMTMFYLGGDPAYITLAYDNQRLIDSVKEGRYTYVVTYYLGNRTLNESLDMYNYTQVAPRAWKLS